MLGYFQVGEGNLESKQVFLGSVLEEARSTLSSRGNTTERCVVHVLKQMSKRKGSYYLIKITCNDGNMH